MRSKELRTSDLLNAIIGEAEVALRKARFEPNIQHMHRMIDIIEARIKRFKDEQSWSLIDRLFREAEEK